MAETVFLNDGSMEVIACDTGVFLERLLKERLGQSAAWCFADYAAELKDEARSMRDEAEQYERMADGYRGMCLDACDALREIMRLLDAPRPNKEKLRRLVQTAYKELWMNL